MPKSTNAPTVPKGAITLVEDSVSPPQLMPDEDPAAFDAMRDVLFADLSPATPYERVLARNLVDLEWEALRHRRFRDHLICAEYRDFASRLFSEARGGMMASFEPSETDKACAFDLLSSDPEERAAAEDELAKLQIAPSEILSKAYKQLSRDLEPHERKLAEIEVRRRRLREDLDRLKAAKAKPVEDAEILDAK